MGIGEAGGQQEHFAKRPFVGKAGSVLTSYLRAAGLPRHELRIGNVYPFWTGVGNPDPTPRQILQEEWRLKAELKRCRPKVIATIGRVSTQWFLGDVDMETVHGIPHFSQRAPGATIVPCFHPASGFYEPSRAALSQEDFLRFAYYLRNPIDTRKRPRIKVVFHHQAPEWIEDAAVDTEGLADRPWGMSWSTDGRTTHVWLYLPGKRVPKLRGRIGFHHALHDLVILRAMGISTAGLEVDDTMVRLFNLQLEPQGLKAAAYRHLGLKMMEFDEVVRPAFNSVAVRWLKKAAKAEYPKPDPIPVADYHQKKNRIYSPQSVGRRINNTLRTWEKQEAERKAGLIVEKPIRLEKRWEEIGETEWVNHTELYQSKAEAAVGTPFPDFSLHIVGKKKAVKYSGIDAAATRLLEAPLSRMVKDRGLSQVYEMDRRALRFIDRMREVGMRVDLPRLKTFESDLETRREAARKTVQRVVRDRWFNPGSADQVAQWLYSWRGLPVMTYTDKGRGSTSDSALQMLRGYHAEDPEVAAFLTGIQDYRESDKFLGSFVRPMFLDLEQDREGSWRIHWDFKATRVVSGRLAGRLLTMPTRTEWGKKIRHCFIAGEGRVLVDADLSQLELRIGAHFSRDPRMRAAFENDEDLHALTASILFKLPLSKIAKDSPQRYVAKTINFAVFYGISAKALLEQLYEAGIFRYQLEDCQRFITDWFKIYGSVRHFQERLWKQAEEDGFVRTLWGRLCYVPNLRVVDEKLREKAQRLAANFPVQGTGSDTTKRAEIRLFDYIEENGLREEVRPWLQMHDELLLEVKEERAQEMQEVLEVVMTADQRRFSVPIKAKAVVARSWGEAK